jgi:hypothetical protein
MRLHATDGNEDWQLNATDEQLQTRMKVHVTVCCMISRSPNPD